MTAPAAPTPFALGDFQNVTIGIAPGPDAAGNPGAPWDAGSVTATLSDGTELTAAVSADQSSVLVTALGPLTPVGQADVLTVAGTQNNGADSVTGTFPINTDAEASTTVTFTPGAPVPN
jgi:hypothetical protein